MFFVILVDDVYCVAIHDLAPVLTALFSIELGGFNSNHFCLLSAAPVNHDEAVQLIFVFNGLLLSTNSMFYIHESD